MSFFSALRTRTTAVVAGAAVLTLAAGGGAFASGKITTDDIKNKTIQAIDMATGSVNSRVIQDGTVRSVDIRDGAVRTQDLHSDVLRKLDLVQRVSTLHGDWQPRSTDTAGVTMTGDGIRLGPFANGGACDNAGTDFARLDYSGANGLPLSQLKNLVMTGRYSADNDTAGVGSPIVRVFFSGEGTGPDGSEPNRLTFSPNTQAGSENGTGNDTPFVTHEWIVTSGTVRYNDDGDNAPAQEKSWSTWVAQFPDAQITNINVLNGCSAGTNLTSLIRSFEVNGTTFQFSGVN